MEKKDLSLKESDDSTTLPCNQEKFPQTASDSSNLINQSITAVSVPIREDLVMTAVSFLLNPKVINNSLINKRTFLLKKGLTSDEIDIAIEKSINQSRLCSNSNPQTNEMMMANQPTFWSTTRLIVSPLAFISLAAYGSYYVYKRFVEPKLFGTKHEPIDHVQNEIEELVTSVKNLERSLQTLESDFQSSLERFLISSSRPNPVECAAINDLKTEICSIKSLLLNKNQFPLTLSSSSSIPSWQLSDQLDDTNEHEATKNGAVAN